MPRKKLEAPAPLTETLGATLPAVIEAEAESKALTKMSEQEADRLFGDGLPFDEERVYGAIGSRMSLSLQMLVEIVADKSSVCLFASEKYPNPWKVRLAFTASAPPPPCPGSETFSQPFFTRPKSGQ